MGPGPSTSVLPPIRQSCDRCHKQKLRCKRPQDATAETCERCLRKGVKCTYSSSLPKGRPSTYRLSNGSPDLSCSVDLASTIMPAPGGSKTTDGQRVAGVTDLQSLVGDFAPVTADSAGASPDFWSQFMQNDENDMAMTGILPDVDISFDPLPTPPSIQSAPQQTPGQHGQQQYQTIKFVENPPPRQQSGQQIRPAQQRHVNQIVTASAPPSAQQAQNADSVDIWSGHGQLNESIVHLSQLSARLSSLLTSSRDVPIATVNGAGGLSADESSAVLQLQSSIGAVFESINSWLAQGTARPPTGHSQQHMTSTTPSSQSQLMSHTLAASSEMTQILYRLRTISNNSTPEMTPPDSSGGGGSPLSESSQHPYCTIRYLVVVCVTLLLNTYIAIIISLQHSADTLKTHQWSSSQQHQQQTHQEASVCPWDTMDRIKLQFVGVVQMCSSFMRRQSEVPEMLMPSHLSPELQGTNTSWDAVGKLKVELEQRLRRLQNCLDMVA